MKATLSLPVSGRLMTMIALTAVLTACSTTTGHVSAAPSGTPSSGPIHWCRTGDLHVVRDPHSAYTATDGTYLPIDFVNQTLTPCWMAGYPRVFGIGATPQLNTKAVALPGSVTRVVLKPNYTAHVWVQIRGASGKKEAGCTPFTASGFRVFAPHSTERAWVPYPFTSCVTASRAPIAVRPIGQGLGNPAVSP